MEALGILLGSITGAIRLIQEIYTWKFGTVAATESSWAGLQVGEQWGINFGQRILFVTSTLALNLLA